MMGKQSLIDVLVVLVVPALFIGGYYFWWRTDSTSLLSVSSGAVADRSADEPGAKTRLALETLNTITLSDALFKDPAFLSLKTYRVEIPTVPLSRAYPFTQPQILLDRMRAVRFSGSGVLQSAPATPVVSAKLDALKKSGQ